MNYREEIIRIIDTVHQEQILHLIYDLIRIISIDQDTINVLCNMESVFGE